MQASFFVQQLRYQFRAMESIAFGPAGAANFIRGALGWNLRRGAGESTYRRLFEPAQAGSGPSGLADWPRPFVLRASHLDGITVPGGETFQFDVHLFEVGEKSVEAVNSLGAAFALMPKAQIAGLEINSIQVDLAPAPGNLSRLRVEFITPTELKGGGELVEQPEFPVLFARVRDRVATLRDLYGGSPLIADFVGLGERSRNVVMESCDLQRVDRTRTSSRTGQTHGLGGFTGRAIYSGNLGEFWPWLEAAQWTGVGRQTVWGKGQIAVGKV